MMYYRVGLTFLAILLVSTIAWAFPTGTIWIPNDSTLAPQSFRLDNQLYFTLDKRPSDASTQAPFIDEGITYGLFKNESVASEVGLDWWEPEPQENLKSLHAHFKIVTLESTSMPSLAFGIYDFGFRSNSSDENILFIGFGKSFHIIDHFFFGFFSGNPNILVDDSGNPASRGFMVGLQKNMTKKFLLLFDFQSSNSLVGAASLGTSWLIHDDVSLLVGYNSYINRKLQRDTLTVQVSLGL
jgi:hypothetical protein